MLIHEQHLHKDIGCIILGLSQSSAWKDTPRSPWRHPSYSGDPSEKKKTKGPVLLVIGLLGSIPEPGPWREPEGESLVEGASAHGACPGGLIPGC